MKKFISVLFMLAFLLGNQVAFASGPFNGQGGDCPGIGIGNWTQKTGLGEGTWGCWDRKTISADQGDLINVMMYYHNNTNSNLNDVEASLTHPPTGAVNSFIFSGNMNSEQGSTSLGNVTVNITGSPQTITFDHAYWLNNEYNVKNDIDVPFLSGQSNDAVINGGVSLGSIPQDPTYKYYGEVLVVFRVGEDSYTPPPQTQCYVNFNNVNQNSNILPNSPVYLSWDTNADTVNIPGVGTYSGSNSATVYPSSSRTYSISAYGGNCSGTASDSISVNIQQQQNQCYVDSFYASPSSSVQSNSAVTLYWNTNGNNVTISGINGTYGSNGSVIVYPSSTTTYTLYVTGNCSGSNNSRSITVYVNQPQTNLIVSTTIATNVTTNSATLNGLVTNNNNSLVNTYFEYGPTVNLGYKTSVRSTNGGTNTPISDVVTGLSSNSIYFFRAVGESGGYASRGSIQVFQTLGATVRPVIVQGTTVVGTASPIMLKIENRYQGICNGDIVDYTVTYKNIGSKKLIKPMVQVVLPGGVNLINSSRGTYDNTIRTLSVPIDDLSAGEEGTIFLQAKVDSLELNIPQIVTTAVLVYTAPNGAQENAIAYSVNNPGNCNQLLGASAFFTNFTPGGLFFWLLLIIVILLIILIVRTYKRRYILGTKKEINQIS